MSLVDLRRRRLESAVRLHQKGQTRVVWINGVLYGGGTLFVLYNALDYLIEPQARPTPVELGWFFLALALSIALGYLYGRFTWRSLDRLFGAGDGASGHPVQ